MPTTRTGFIAHGVIINNRGAYLRACIINLMIWKQTHTSPPEQFRSINAHIWNRCLGDKPEQARPG